MQVTRHIGEWRGDRIVSQTVTIHIENGDDPLSNLNGLVTDLGATTQDTRLTAFLSVYSTPELLEQDDEPEHMLRKFGFVASMLRSRTKDVAWYARDTLGMSWRKLGDALVMSPSSVRRMVQSYRLEMAESGSWRTTQGLHNGTPEDARTALADLFPEVDDDD